MPLDPRHVTLRRVLAVKAAVGVAVAFGLAGGFYLRSRGLTIEELGTEMRRTEPRYAWTPVVDANDYHTTDGVHLTGPGAIRYAGLLVQTLKSIEAAKR